MNLGINHEKKVLTGTYNRVSWEFQVDTHKLIVSKKARGKEPEDVVLGVKKDGRFTKAAEGYLETDSLGGVPTNVISGLRAMGMFSVGAVKWADLMAEQGHGMVTGDHKELGAIFRGFYEKPSVGKEKPVKAEETVTEETVTEVPASDLTPLPGTSTEALVPEVVNDARAFELAEAIEEIIGQTERNFILLSRHLYEIEKNGYYKQLGFNNTGNLGQERFALEYRTIMHMIKIGRVIDTFDVDEDTLLAIGYTKMTKIAGAMLSNPEKAKNYLAIADGITVKDLESQVRKREGKVTTDALRLSLKFDSAAAKVVSEALETAEEQIQEKDVKKAFLSICQDWLTYNQSSNSISTLEDHMRVLEERFGVVITAAGADGVVIERESDGMETPVEVTEGSADGAPVDEFADL